MEIKHLFVRESLLKLKGDPFRAEKAQKRFLCSSVLLAQRTAQNLRCMLRPAKLRREPINQHKLIYHLLLRMTQDVKFAITVHLGQSGTPVPTIS